MTDQQQTFKERWTSRKLWAVMTFVVAILLNAWWIAGRPLDDMEITALAAVLVGYRWLQQGAGK